MLFNTVNLKPGVRFEDVEMAPGEMCDVVKKHCGGEQDGFVSDQDPIPKRSHSVSATARVR